MLARPTSFLLFVLSIAMASSLYATARFRAQTPPPIAIGVAHACGVTTAGDPYCWGQNDDSQLGDGTTEARTEPVRVGGNLKAEFIGVAAGRACALAPGGAAYCWGRNQSAQIGNGTVGTPVGQPQAVKGGLTFKELAVGPEHTCGLTMAGQAYCWGKDSYGQLGDGSTINKMEPKAVWPYLNLTFSTIAIGLDHTCALTAAGEAYCWGANANGQVGDTTRTPSRGTPTKVITTQKFASLALGSQRSCALTTEGQAYCWGLNDNGMLGDGTTDTRTSPVAVAGGMSFTSISAGAYHTCALTAAGKAFCWGQNGMGQLGDGTLGARTRPVPIAPTMTFAAIAAGTYTTCGITANGEASCWGQDVTKKLGTAGATLVQPTRVGGALMFRPRAGN